MSNKALLILDVINELIHEKGSVGKDGYFEQAQKKSLLKNLKEIISLAREKETLIIYVIFGFDKNFTEWSEKTKLFQKVKENNQAILGEWSTKIHSDVSPQDKDYVIVKHRVDPFFGTNLEQVLRSNNIDELFLTGVSSEFVVLASVISGHDRDYTINVIEECVSSSDKYSHDCAIHIMSKLSNVVSINDIKF
ncbi:isochorismatase family cysteine hydrolase [Gallibacterium anatis]|uniref:Cysteine hydrolase n=1 Tax=Gallibacterium anatis TaxID=750 RepID=A0A921HDM6_9PAST|nr:isochorismatase family cysteine hydrolase [Gallibacterium anatis]WIM83980.1 isochorismatase family cysteine hydrolase [Gallibacterium anatis]HJF74672.1 cysteine hydrolase [Gallibacterium anatis]